MKNFTPEDLLRFIYQETTASENEQIELQLSNDWTLNAKFQVMKTAHERLNKMKLMAPRQETIDRILAYASAETSPV